MRAVASGSADAFRIDNSGLVDSAWSYGFYRAVRIIFLFG